MTRRGDPDKIYQAHCADRRAPRIGALIAGVKEP